ncbi:hypothetical protein FNF31_01853 [Cafeteria roenbergensis]|uniref:EGF-like domain-containing protein n=1 Tax=Cafeteria roenbergensis TaxID=33653 RepID=A0A5A8DJX7_CAFRO|nr:hypothetical protein FNF31_01853 [Cafeteria roenbergensis]
MDTEAMRRLQAVARRSTWQKSFQAFSVAAGGRPELERGDKILLPQSALQELGAMEVEYPLKFRLQSPGMDIVAHCGVREFVAEEGRVYLPFWLLSAIGAGEDCPIVVTNVSLPKATYVKLRPRRMAFVELTDPKGVLEVALREFTCVTQGVAIRIPYIGRTFDIDILESLVAMARLMRPALLLVAVLAVFALGAADATCPAGPNGKACAGNGACVNATCQCEGRFLAPDCVKQGCLRGCSGNGQCNTDTGACACAKGYMGEDCSKEVPPCPRSGSGDECGTHGECDASTGKCQCHELWGGPACTQPKCDPLCVGGGHGACDSGRCACDDGWRGNVCQSKQCPGRVRRRRVASDSPNAGGEVGVSVDDDARRRARMAAMAKDSIVAPKASAAVADESSESRFRSSADHFASNVNGAVADAHDALASLLQTKSAGASASDETAAAILAAAGSVDADPLASASATDGAAEGATPTAQTTEAAPEAPEAPAAAIAEGLSVWRFRERRGLRTGSGGAVPEADADAALRAALGLAGDDSALAKAAAEEDGSMPRLAAVSSSSSAASADKPVAVGSLLTSDAADEDAPEDEWVVEYCGGHGVCRGEGKCDCDSGWAGDACQLRTCPAGCSGNGECDTSTGSCTCSKGFYGPDCSQQRCPGLVELDDPDLPQVECHGHGDCDTATGKCSCRHPWLGEGCGERACPGITEVVVDGNATKVSCNNRGTCLQHPLPGTCKCSDGWIGAACATPACGPSLCGAKASRGRCHTLKKEVTDEHGISSKEDPSPSDDGAKGVCECAPGFAGEHCELALCPGPGGSCSGHGRCDTLSGVCICEGAWGGRACDRPAVVHGIVVGRRYPVSLYEKLRAGERNRAEIVVALAKESAAEAARQATIRRREREGDSETTTVGDVLVHGSDEADEAASLLQARAERRRSSHHHRGGAVLSADGDEAKKQHHAGNGTHKAHRHHAKGGEHDGKHADECEGEDCEFYDDDCEGEDCEYYDECEGEDCDEVGDAAEDVKDPVAKVAIAKAQRAIEAATKPKPAEPEPEEGSEADIKAAPKTGVPTTLADALHITHRRARLRRRAGLLNHPKSVTVETAASGGGDDNGIVFLTRCDPGWTGPTCSERISSFRCNGGAGCGTNGNCTRYGCLCDRGWSGYDCSVPAAKLACPVGVPMEAEGYYRRALELRQAEEEKVREKAEEYERSKRREAKAAAEELRRMDEEAAAKQKAAADGTAAIGAAEAEAHADEVAAGTADESFLQAAASSLRARAGATHRLRRSLRAAAKAAAHGNADAEEPVAVAEHIDPARAQAAIKALSALRGMQESMRGRHTYMHGRGVGVPCSGRGVCGTDGHCACNDGYSGIACERRVVQHGVCTPRERDEKEQERLERQQVERQAAAADSVRIAQEAAQAAALRAEAAEADAASANAAGGGEGADSSAAANTALLRREMHEALEQAARLRSDSLGRPAMLPPPELECICGTVPDEDAAFPGQMYRGPACDKRTCPGGCSGHGSCDDDGKCQCRAGWAGRDCSKAACPASCSYRGHCKLSAAVEHTVAGALVGSRKTRSLTPEERQERQEAELAAEEGDDLPAGPASPATVAGALSGIEGLRRAAGQLGSEGRLALGAALTNGAAVQQENATAAASGGGRPPSATEVAQAVEDLIANAVSPNEAAAYSEDGAAAAADTPSGEEALEENEEAMAEEEQAAFLQRTGARARARRAHQAEDGSNTVDSVTELAKSIERVETASKKAEQAATEAQKAAADAKSHADSAKEASEADSEEADTEADAEAPEENEKAEEAEAEEGSKQGEAEADESAEAGESKEENEDDADSSAAAAPAAPAREQVLANVVLAGRPISDEAPPSDPAELRSWRLERAIEAGTDPFSLGFPVKATCECDLGWAGVSCERRICPEGCSGHGVCDPDTQRCTCAPGWAGLACAVRADGGCEGGCGGDKRGRCVEGRCFCRHPYTGKACGLTVCKDDCNAHGSCQSSDGTCVCRSGWTGETCATKACPRGCAKHGDCDSTTKECHCHAGWAGEDCSVRTFEQKKEPEPEPEAPVPSPSPSPTPKAKPASNETGFVSLERPAHSMFGGTDVLMVLG